MRAFYKHGVEKLHVHWVIGLLPALLHISLFLFFAGLSAFLFGVNLTIFKIVTTWIALCVILYAYLTFLPIIHKDSPYSAPLSELVAFCLTGIRHVFLRLLRPRGPRAVHLDDLFSSISKTAEKSAFKLKPDIDHRSLLSMFQSLDEDTDLARFFEGLPRLCDSKTGKRLNLKQDFIKPHKERLSSALIGLMNRTLSSDLLTEFEKQRRMIIYTKAIASDSASLVGPWWTLRFVLFGDWYKFLQRVEFGVFVLNWKNISDKVTSFYAQCVAALTISIVRDRDERWFQLAGGLHNASKSLLHKYLTHGDSVPLANVIYIVRRTVQTYSGSAERHRNDILDASSRVLMTIHKLDIRNTLPELQHEFCGLWNQLVITAQTDQLPHHVSVSTLILKIIRKLHIDLHESYGYDTLPTAFHTVTDGHPALDDPWSYPRCDINDHRHSLVPELQFDEPPPDAAGDAPPKPSMTHMPVPYPPARSSTFTPKPMPSPTFPYPPARTSTFTTPYHSSFPPVPPHYDTPLVDQSSHSAASPSNIITPFSKQQLARSRDSNVSRREKVQSPPPPSPPPLPPSSSFPSHYDAPSVDPHLAHYHSTISLPDTRVPLPDSRVSFPP